MTKSPVTPARAEHSSPPACPGAPVRTPVFLNGNEAVTPHTPTPSTNDGATVLSSSPITPADVLGNSVAELEATTAQLSVDSNSDTAKEVVLVVNGEVNGEASAGDHEVQMPSANHVETEAGTAPNGILATSGARGNGREREVSFVLPAKGGDDPFGHGSSGNTPNGHAGGPPAARGPFRPRGDRESVALSNDNAQGLLPPSSCVFVANLTAHLADEQLEYKVKEKFEQFGNCYVKIKRDRRGMPFAFAQFENFEDAERAILQGRGMMIEGRPCRTERAKVNRALFLTRSTGGPINPKEAYDILSGCGDLEKVWIPTDTDMEMFRLSEGIWVQFAFFDDCRDAQLHFKENAYFRLEQPPSPEELRNRVGRTSFGRTSTARPVPRSVETGPRKVIFVGNLTSLVTQTELKGKFDRFGLIDAVELVSRTSAAGTRNTNHFAFITFRHEDDARMAVDYPEPVFIRGRRLRVELRGSRNSPRSFSTHATTDGSPVGRGGYVAGASPDGGTQATGYHAQGTSSAGAGPGVYQVPWVYPYYPSQYASYVAQPYATNYGYASSANFGTYVQGPVNGQYGNGYVMPALYYANAVDVNGNAVAELSGNDQNTQS